MARIKRFNTSKRLFAARSILSIDSVGGAHALDGSRAVTRHCERLQTSPGEKLQRSAPPSSRFRALRAVTIFFDSDDRYSDDF